VEFILILWCIGGIVNIGITVMLIDKREGIFWKIFVFVLEFGISWYGVGLAIGRIWKILADRVAT